MLRLRQCFEFAHMSIDMRDRNRDPLITCSDSPQLSGIVDRFELLLVTRKGNPVDLVTFLQSPENAVPTGEQNDLLQEIIAIDIEYRWQQAGKQHAGVAPAIASQPGLWAGPRLEEYAARFPELLQDGSVPLAGSENLGTGIGGGWDAERVVR